MKSIRRRLTVGLLCVFTALLGGGGILIYFSTRAALLAQIDARLRIEALAVVKQTQQEQDDDGEGGNKKVQGSTSEAQPSRELEVRFTETYMPEFQGGGAEYFQVWSPDGQTVQRSRSLVDANLPRLSGPVDHPAFWTFTLPNGLAARAVGMSFVPPTAPNESKGHDPNFTATLVVASGLGQLNKTLLALRGVLFGVGGLGLLAILLVVPETLRRGLSPLRRVSDHAMKLEAANLRLNFPTKDMPVELQPICLRLNELLSRLQKSFDRERCFSADVAHELRTPIAELRALAEVSLRWPQSESARVEAFEDGLAIARQMESVVVSLLTITRCEAGHQTIQREEINLAKWIEDRWRPFATQAKAQKLVVNFDIPPGELIQTDPALAGVILTNLFSNAVCYTPQGGTVLIQLQKAGNESTLKVTNSIDGFLCKDLSMLFERFWRKDTARTSSEHSGLGLALSKACSEILGLQLTASLDNHHLSLSVKFKTDARKFS